MYGSDVYGNLTDDIFLMNSDGSNIHRLTYADGQEGSQISWSPNSNRIVFATGEASDGYFDNAIAIINRDGSNRTILTDYYHNYSPDWSPWPIKLQLVGVK
jgi:Tol biopolymer transport system component